MNVLDIIILLILIFAAVNGARDGLIIQGFSIVGVAIGIYLGSHYGENTASLLGIEGDYSTVWGFIIVLILAILTVSVLARIIRKLLHFVGFGLVDVVLGAAISVCKFLIIMSILFASFNLLNSGNRLCKDTALQNSKLYQPIANISNWATPAWSWTMQQFDV